MSDLLSASSMFLAVISLLYSSWYSEIAAHIMVKGKTDFKSDNKETIEKVKNTLLFRSLPLLLSSLILFLIILPESIKIINDSYNYLYSPKFSIKDYDSVKTLFCTIVLATFFLFIHLSYLTYQLKKNYDKLNK